MCRSYQTCWALQLNCAILKRLLSLYHRAEVKSAPMDFKQCINFLIMKAHCEAEASNRNKSETVNFKW
jgi:hypothetical protein